MKTAIYIEDGTAQLVITPETEFEKKAMATFQGKEVDAKLFSGSFYDCRGGWVRQAQVYNGRTLGEYTDDQSLILRVATGKAS